MEQNTVLATGIIYNAASQFASVGTIYYNCSYRIASVIDSYGESHIQYLVTAASLNKRASRSVMLGAVRYTA
jgi:hypothetical protein